MAVFAIADLHLALSVPEKTMEVFGERWHHYMQRIQDNWTAKVGVDDLVLIPGDISWAMRLEQAAVDLAWVGALKGTKVLIRGNHDYWWQSLSRLSTILPPSCHLIQNNAFTWKGISIAGSRLWECDEIQEELEGIDPSTDLKKQQEDRRIFERELGRLEMSLKCLDKEASHRIVMTHYPPIGPHLKPTRASQLFERYGVELSLFGHLHNVPFGSLPYGISRGIRYILCSGDYLEFDPIQIL